MSGVAIARALLAANANLLAVVPATRIMAGILPINTALPCISILQISATPRVTVKVDEGDKLITERVQVTVEASTYPQQKQIMELVRDAMPLSRGTVNGFACDSVVPDSEGPDIFDPDLPAYIQSMDFMIVFSR
jgi:hypothetical protein